MNKLIALCALSTLSLCASESTPPDYPQDSSFAVVEKTDPEQAAHDQWLQLVDAADIAGLVEHARQAIRKEDIYEAYGTLTIAAALDKTGDAACELARRLTDDERCALDLQRLKKYVRYHDCPMVKDYFIKYLRVAASRKNPLACELLESIVGEKPVSCFRSDSIEDLEKIIRTRNNQTVETFFKAKNDHWDGILDIEPNKLHVLGFATYLCHAYPKKHNGPQALINCAGNRVIYAEKIREYMGSNASYRVGYREYEEREVVVDRSFNYPIQPTVAHLLTYKRQAYERNKTAQTTYTLAEALKAGSEYEDLIVESYNLDKEGPAKDTGQAILLERRFEAALKRGAANAKARAIELESQGQASSSSGFRLNPFSRK